MKIAAAFCILAAAWCAPTLAQVNSEKARLDDFAVAPAEEKVGVGQVTAEAASVTVEQRVERSIVTPPAMQTSSRNERTEQLGKKDDKGPVVQLAPVGERVTTAAAPLSRREDGRPTGAERIAGTDRCDPQVGSAQVRAECRRILELRAAEFSATEAPRLSAEQELLARQTPRSGTSLATDFTVDRADKSLFDADERNSQELGFITLNQSPSSTDTQIPGDAAGTGALSDAVKSVLVQIGIPNP